MIKVEICPVCKSKKLHPYKKVKDYSVSKETFQLMKCTECGLIITSPRPIDEELPKYYISEDYVSHNDSSKGLINSIYQRVKKITLRQKEALISSYQTKKTLLDIGCGTGDFIKQCELNNWSVFGLEPDEGARKIALQKVPGKVEPGESLFTLKKSFGTITLWHVLEHVSNLNEYFNQFNRLLEDNGRLIIALPNPESPDAEHYNSYWAAYDVPRHLFHFTKNNISMLAQNHGFELEDVKPMLFDSYYVSMLSEKYKSGSIFYAAINGLKSNVKARNKINHSSLIYIFSKKQA